MAMAIDYGRKHGVEVKVLLCLHSNASGRLRYS